jgi:4'-phosphopantetheinyl transferase
LDAAESGKPFIPGAPGFSISHSGEVVVLAVAGDGEIGIDIEKIREVDIDDFSRDLPEIANLSLHYDEDRIRGLFFDCWTRKEAVLKGCGKGLSVPLTRVMLKERTALLHDTTWFIEKVRIEDAYCCHVATERPLEHVAVERVNLMNGWV